MKEIVTIVLSLIAFGCVTNDVYNRSKDPARWIMRHCPVKYVEGDEASLAVLHRPWTGGKVLVMGECTHDCMVIKDWAEAKGIKCRIDKTLRGGKHWGVVPKGSDCYLNFVMGVGIVIRKLNKE